VLPNTRHLLVEGNIAWNDASADIVARATGVFVDEHGRSIG